MPPKVSVIVPNYNHEKFLRERLESIFKQTYQDFEVILLDDFSTDNSVDILKEYAKHEKVSKVVFNQVNSGSPFRQWKKGIELANGEYIWIAESDDYADLQLLERFIPKLDSGADLVYCRSMKVDKSGKKINNEFWPDSLDRKRWKHDFENSGFDEICDYLAYRTTIPNASSCIFRNKKNMFTEEIINSRFTGDWVFWVNYLKDSRLAYSSETLNYHRYHQGATRLRKDTNSLITRMEERMKAVRLARAVCKKGRISFNEYRKYKYMVRTFSKLKKEVGVRSLLRKFPPEFIIYTYLFDINEIRHNLTRRWSKNKI